MSKNKRKQDNSPQSIKFAVWCETCMDWKIEFRVDNSNLWILCNDCDEGLIKVIKNEKERKN